MASTIKKKVPLAHFFLKPIPYIQLLNDDEAQQISLVDDQEKAKLLIVSLNDFLPVLKKSVLFELKKHDNKKEYKIDDDLKKVFTDLQSKNSQKFALNDFILNTKFNCSELLNNNYAFHVISNASKKYILVQQNIIKQYATVIINKYSKNSKKEVATKGNSSLSQAQDSLLKIARKLSMFKGMNEAEIIEVTTNVRFIHYNPKELIFEQNTYGQEIYYVLSGAINIVLMDAERKIIPLATLPFGNVIGELAPILKQNRSASAYAHHDTRLLGFHINFKAEENHPRTFLTLFKNFTKILSDKLLESNEKLKDKNK